MTFFLTHLPNRGVFGLVGLVFRGGAVGVVRLERLHDRTIPLFLSKELKLLCLREEVGGERKA